MSLRDRKERDFKRREREILDAALTLSSTDDWQSVTIEQIAQAAEIGKGTVYKHFATKEEIYALLALDFHGGVLDRLRQLPPTRSFADAVRATVWVFWEAYKVGFAYQGVVQYCEREDFRRALSPATRERFDELEKGFSEVTGGLLKAGIGEGIFPKKPSPLALFGAQSALYGALRMGWSGCIQGKDNERYSEELTEFILAGLTRRSGKAR